MSSILHQLQSFLYEQIPLTKTLNIELVSFDENGLCVKVPLAPNVNDKGTAFAGSLSAAITISGWSMVQLLVQTPHEQSIKIVHGVIQTSTIDYIKPVNQDFEIICLPPRPSELKTFQSMLAKKKKGRLRIDAQVNDADGVVVEFRGVYVVSL